MKEQTNREDYPGEKLAIRLEVFGGEIIRACEALPTSRAGKHVEDQLRRSGTAVGAHHAEAQGAQSRKDFIHKLSLSLKEAREARYWLGVALHAGYAPDLNLARLQDESTELIAILQASQSTARRNAKR
jgi:four helix bundle protein